MIDSSSVLPLFLDKNSSITVFFANPRLPSKECIVIFSALGGRQLGTKIGGSDPLLREGIDVVCVQSNCDDWHQNISLSGIGTLRTFLDTTYISKKGYGSSMGGYGAILYAERLQLGKVLALSPQYTISEDFDKRWRLLNERISWKYTMEMANEYSGDIHLIYDPLDLDGQHAELIKRNFRKANVCSVEIKYGSHPITRYFHDSGVLKTLLLSFARDSIEIPKINNKQNKTYLNQLSIALSKKGKMRSAKTVILKSILLGDERNYTYRQASNICHRLADYDGAIFYAEKAINARDNTDISLGNHKAHLARMLRLGDRIDGNRGIG